MKFSLGLLQLALGFVVFGMSIHFLNSATQVPFLFVFVGYLLITTGELFLSPIGLAKVTQLAPKKIIAFMMGVWFLSSTFAHYISGAIYTSISGSYSSLSMARIASRVPVVELGQVPHAPWY